MSSTALTNKPKRKPSNRSRVWFWADECKYEVILNKAKSMGWKLIDDEKNEHNSNLFWIDVAAIHERFRTIQPWQIINHFPGMPNIARKNRMGQNLNKMQKVLPTEYNFYPRTWVLPGEFPDFEKQFDGQGNSSKIYIIKPDTGCQGRGIFLTKRLDQVPRNENVVAQVYIKKPMLLDDYKFDLRIYCFVSSVRPLRVYLFHDGLVRMCTEKYVKPTKQNLDQSCMHLTNYSLNKNNSNFQQSSASTSDDYSKQEESHKRSLVWFMDYVRSEFGDAKADWLWRRIGILCVRTILSILPTLSRDYQQHFKSFGNIPVDIDSILANSAASVAAAKAAERAKRNESTASGASSKPDSARSGRTTPTGQAATSAVAQESDEDADEEDVDAESTSRKNSVGEENTGADACSVDGDDGSVQHGDAKGGSTASDGIAGGGKDKDKEPGATPKMRGSRAFEVLGFDIMLDDKLKPWLIEVNHLPSFGTDSPLDLDIKRRLMDQVFNVLPARADDDVAYNAYHQVESEKRLHKGRAEVVSTEADKKNSGTTNRSRSLDRGSDPQSRPKPTETPSAEQEEEALKKEAEKKLKEAKEAELTQVAHEKAATALSTAALAAAQSLCSGMEMPHFMFTVNVDDYGETTIITSTIIDGELPAQRLSEICEILAGIYEEYCPEKISKIDRLLYKYQGREEEFIQFVVQKYSVREDYLANVLERVLQKYHPIVIPKIVIKKTAEGDEEDKKNRRVPRPPGANAATNRPQWGGGNNSKRSSRSLSPPGASSARSQASWKGGNAEEEEAFKEEILAAHVPKDDDEWMNFELKHLHQFTKIFPAPSSNKTPENGTTGGNENGLSEQEAAELEARDEEEEDNDKDDDNAAASSSLASGSKGSSTASKTTLAVASESKPVTKIASFTDIMVQVFIADRRQTMRFHCPLGGRARDNDKENSSLPPLYEPFRSGGTSSSTFGNSMLKAGPGWRPPPVKANADAKGGGTKVPTQSQVEVAKRLTQGMSSAPLPHNANKPKTTQGQGVGNNSFVFQLDKETMDDQSSIIGANMQMSSNNGAVSSAGAAASLYAAYGLGGGNTQVNGFGQEIPMHPRISKLVEESRLARLRLEQSKSTAASVLRQQVFHFDPMAASNAAAANAALMAAACGSGNGGPMLNPQQFMQMLPGGGNGVPAGGAGGSMNVAGAIAANGNASATGANIVGGSNNYTPAANGNGPTRFGVNMKMAMDQRNASGGGGGPAGQPGVFTSKSGGRISDENSQEEMLRSYFPGWF